MATGRKKRTNSDKVSLEMTPMIDVVFQLLIFFIVTLKQEDITAYLEAMRPMPDPNPGPVLQEPTTISIGKYPDGKNMIVLDGTGVTEPQLRERLSRMARTNSEVTIMIKCTDNSAHGILVRVLDVCNDVGLRKLAVFSM